MEQSKWPQVAEAIAGRIRSGAVPVDSRLPRAADLARDLGVAERTCRKAVSYLAGLGYLRVVPNVGIYAAAVPPDPLPELQVGGDPLAVLQATVEDQGRRLAELEQWRRQRDGR